MINKEKFYNENVEALEPIEFDQEAFNRYEKEIQDKLPAYIKERHSMKRVWKPFLLVLGSHIMLWTHYLAS